MKFVESELTADQKDVLERISDPNAREYQKIVYDVANRAYSLIPEDQDPEETKRLLREVTELLNHQNLPESYPLPKPSEEYSPLARQIIGEVTRDASVHSASSAITELKKVLEETRGIPFAPTGLTGATITTVPGEGTTAVKKSEWG